MTAGGCVASFAGRTSGAAIDNAARRDKVRSHALNGAHGMVRVSADRTPPMRDLDSPYQASTLSPEDVQRLPGAVLLDFGTDWCGHCSAARAAVQRWLDARSDIAHLRIEDGRGHPLGRAFRVKLWPTLVLLHDGVETARAVRPREDRDLQVLDTARP